MPAAPLRCRDAGARSARPSRAGQLRGGPSDLRGACGGGELPRPERHAATAGGGAAPRRTAGGSDPSLSGAHLRGLRQQIGRDAAAPPTQRASSATVRTSSFVQMAAVPSLQLSSATMHARGTASNATGCFRSRPCRPLASADRARVRRPAPSAGLPAARWRVPRAATAKKKRPGHPGRFHYRNS